MSALPSDAAQGGPIQEVQDSELVRRIRRGSDEAFEQLYNRYHRRITSYILGMVHDHGRAEDIAQDVFVSALRRMRETDRPIAFKPWVYEIAKNACIDHFRRSRRAEEVSYDADEGMGAADYGRLVSSEAMPESELESKQNLDHLRGAFGGLSDAHHEILVMRELEGLSYREIGERLGMSRPSVESTLFRARRRLTEEYEELVSGARCLRVQAIIAGAVAAAPGARDQRRLARHVSHCQPCRRHARLAGLDIPVTSDRPVRERIAAMLPLPLFLRRRWSADSADASSLGTSHASGFAQWSAQLGASMDPSWLKAAATAVTVAVAGAGAGLAGSAPGTQAPIGSFGQVLPSFDGADGGDGAERLAARGRISAGLLTRTAAVSTPAAASAPAGTAVTAREPGHATATAPVSAPAPTADLDGVGSDIMQVAQAVAHPPAAGDSPPGSGATGPASPSTGASAPQTPALPDAPAIAPPADPPNAPPVDASAPDLAGAAAGAAGAAGDALKGSLNGQ